MSARVHPAAVVEAGARLGEDVSVGPGTIVGPHVSVGDRTRIGGCALLTGWTTLGPDCEIHHGAVLGSPPQDLKYTGEAPSYLEIGAHTVVREYATANLATDPGQATRVGEHCLLMAYAHVAHDCFVGDRTIFVNGATLAGHVRVEDHATIGAFCTVHQFCRVGRYAYVGALTAVTQDAPPFSKVVQARDVRSYGVNTIGLERHGFDAERIKVIERAYRLLLRSKLNTTQAIERMRATLNGSEDVSELIQFIESAERGLIK